MFPTPSAFLVRAIVFVVVIQALGALSALPVGPAIDEWYRHLEKPRWTPPAAVFPPVWIVLYTMIGIAGALLYRVAPGKPGAQRAMAFFVAQLLVNFAYSPVFFGLRSTLGGTLVILLLLALLVPTVAYAHRVSRVAAYLLVPYLAWVAYAATVAAGVWLLNR